VFLWTASLKPSKKATSKGALKPMPGVPRAVGTVLPNRLNARLEYWDYQSLDPSAGAFGTYVFCPSSLYDPNYTGVGHQPMGFDQLAAVYAHYAVTKCKITVSFSPTSVTTIPYVVGILKSHDNGSAGPWAKVLEQGPGVCTYELLSGGTNIPCSRPNLSLTYSAAKDAGVVDLVDSDLSAGVGSSPVDNYYFVIFIQAADLSADPPWTALTVHMEFDALFYAKQQLVQS